MIDITQQRTLEKIRSIILSCETVDQISNVQNWLNNLNERISNYNESYIFKHTILGELKYKYKQLRNKIDWIFLNFKELTNRRRYMIYKNKIRIRRKYEL